jgi:tetraacyldisaccharide 4'-kinase
MNAKSTATQRWVSEGWSRVNRAARWARDQGLIPAKKLPVRTIGIGNVQAGGTGKTPLTIRIAEEAIARGMLVAVLSRGYRSAWERIGGIIVPQEPTPVPGLCGDEVALIRERVPNAWIGVGADRVAQFEKLQAAAREATGRSFDLVLLDDAFQHWRIRCDLQVVAVTETVFGERYFRETYDAISERDLVVLTKGDSFPEPLRNHAQRVRAHYRIEGADPKLRYHFIAALGDPERARAELEKNGFRIETMTAFPDHHPFDSDEVGRLLSEAQTSGRKVLLSGKDGVKWKALGIPLAEFQVVEPSIEILEGKSIWERCLWSRTTAR